MNTRIICKTLVAGLLFLLAALPLTAQSGNQGTLEGTITDPSGAVVSGAQITATNTATGATFSVTAGGDGLFRFPVLSVGTYDISATQSGFSKYVQQGVVLNVGAKLNLPITLALASAQQTVQVSAEAPVVETTRTQVSSTVNDVAVANLPVNGRNFIDFVLLTPAVTRDVRGGDLSFAGQRGTLNSLTIDGTDNNNTFFGQTLGRTGSGRAPYQFSQDAVQEFQVNTNGYSAELGRAGGAVINVITKSGTNSFHGSAFEFFRDRGLNANDPIYSLQRSINLSQGRAAPLKPGYHFNQFGGSVGGPIIKDHLFFFFDYDGQRNTTGNPVLVTLPTPTTANQVAAVNYLQPRIGNYNRTFNQDVYLGKVDYQLNSNNQISARYNAQRFTGQAQENSGSSSAFEHTGASLVNTDTFNTQLTSTLNPNLVNVFRFSYQRDNEPGKANSINPEAFISAPGLSVGRNSFSPRETTLHRQQYADTVSYVRSRHNFRFGADFLIDHVLNFFPGNFSGAYTFTSLETFGASLLGTRLAGSADRLVEAFPGNGTTGPTTHPDLFQSAGFVQDDWRVRNNLTLNFGVRYDAETVKQPSVQNPAALAIGIDTGKIHNDLNNFEPRFGFAWQPNPDHQLVLRGGYGMFYGNTPSIMYGTAHSNNGINVQTLTFTASAASGGNPATALPVSYPNTLCGPPVANAGCAIPAGATLSPPTIYFFQKNYQQPYVQQYNLGVEMGLTRDVSLSVGYLGVKGVHLQRTNDINLPHLELPATIGIAGQPGTLLSFKKFPNVGGNPIRPISQFGRLFEFGSNANSTYNGFITQVTKRFSHNFQALVSYTWSHVIDDVPDATAVVPGTDDGKLVFDPTNFALDRASGNDDTRHRFVVSGVWQLNNYTKDMNPVARAVLGGWEIAGIFTAQSGQPYTAFVSSDLNADGNNRNERVPGTSRNQFNLPAIVSLDPRVTRNFSILERVRFQLIAEAFNVFNRQNITGIRTTQFANSTSASVCGTVGSPCLVPQVISGSPISAANVGANAFGLPSSANINGQGNVGRVLQFAAKFTF
jgi:outer membrane receptor protein involved in Fe transport